MFQLRVKSDFDKGFKEIKREFVASKKKMDYIKKNVGRIFIKYVQKELQGCVSTGRLIRNFGVGSEGIFIQTPTYTIVGTSVPYAETIDIGCPIVLEINAKNHEYMTFFSKKTNTWVRAKQVMRPVLTGKFYTHFAVNNTLQEVDNIFISKSGEVIVV